MEVRPYLSPILSPEEEAAHAEALRVRANHMIAAVIHELDLNHGVQIVGLEVRWPEGIVYINGEPLGIEKK